MSSGFGLQIWDRRKPDHPREFVLGYGTQSVAFLPDGRVAVGVHDGHGSLSRLFLHTLDEEHGGISETVKFPTKLSIWSISVSRDGKWLAHHVVQGHDKQGFVLWDISGTEPKLAWELPQEDRLPSQPAFSSDQRWLACADSHAQGVRLIDLRQSPPREAALLAFEEEQQPSDSPQHGPSAAFLSDGRLATSNGGGTVWLWDVGGERPKRLVKFEGPGPIHAAAQAPVLAMTAGNFVEVWDLSEAEPRLRCRTIGRFSVDNLLGWELTPDGRSLWTAHVNGAVRYWDVSGWEAVEQTPLEPNPANFSTGALAYGPFVWQDLLVSTDDRPQTSVWAVDGTQIEQQPAAAVNGQPLTRWSCRSGDGRFAAAVPSVNPPQDLVVLRRQGRDFKPAQRIAAPWVAAAALSHDGSRLILGGRRVLELWGATDGETPKKKLAQADLSLAEVQQVAFADDRTLVCRGDNRIQLWTVTPNAITLRGELPIPNVWEFAVLADGHTLAVRSDKLQCFDLRTWPLEETLSVAISSSAAAFSPDGKQLAVGHFQASTPGGSVELIDLQTGLVSRRLTFPALVRKLEYTPEGRHLITANANGTIYVVRLAPPPN